MTRGIVWLALAAVTLVAGVGGCTLGPGSQKGSSTLTVTRDFGARMVLKATERKLPKGETAMRILERRAKVETRYGGRFVNAIDGLRSGKTQGRREDWFYFVNGIEADVSAAEKRLYAGDRVWWDYRDWSAAMSVPAVVGSFPEPFLHGSEGKRYPVRLDCAQGADATCRDVARRLHRDGVDVSTTALGAPAGKEVLRFVVGQWRDLRADAAARKLEQGPAASGVFARLAPGGAGSTLLLLDRSGRVARRLPSAGLVAATRFEDQQPTWVVTGTDAGGLRAATRLLDERSLRDRFAVATDGRRELALPLGGGKEG